MILFINLCFRKVGIVNKLGSVNELVCVLVVLIIVLLRVLFIMV